MGRDVIVLNGGSSSGKSSIARCLQVVLERPWLTFGIDDFIDSMPPVMSDGSGIDVGSGGEVTIGPAFRRLEAAWHEGLSAMARAGAGLIVDEVFLEGAASQAQLGAALDGLDVLWVGVRCEREIAMERERERRDRVLGMAAAQAESVHDGVRYDVLVNTTGATAMDCAREIAAAATAAPAHA
jgi:chloramphenicol 3-O phosphotransferase